jgi:iron complex outermembrane recepter protein
MANLIKDNSPLIFIVSLVMASANVSGSILEEVVVTAQKKDEMLKDVSVSVTAFSGSTLKELNMTNSVDIAAHTPGLNIGTPVGEGNNPSITLRGVGLNDFNDNNEGPVAVYRDEVYQSAMAGLTFQIFDLERVEILRGPQGTLYGRNATGGLVNFISEAPDQYTSGYAELTVAENSQIKLEGAIGGSITEKIQARLSLATNDYDGYVENRVGSDANEADNQAYRLQVRFEFTDEWSALLNIHGGESDTNAPKYQHEASDGVADIYGYRDTDGDEFAGDYDRDGVLNIENDGGFVRIDYEGDTVEFVALTAIESVDKLHQEDTDMGPFPGIEPTFGADIEQFSQEFRWAGETDSLSWVAGAFYFSSEVDNTLDLHINWQDGFMDFVDNVLPEADGGTGGLLGAVGYVPGVDPAAMIPFLTYDVDYEQETKSYSVFGQVDYELTDELTLIVGLRYTSEDREFDYINAFGDRDGDGLSAAEDGYFTLAWRDVVGETEWFIFSGDIDNTNVSGKIGIDYQLNFDTLLFASFSRGFKSGGFNGGFLDTSDGILPQNTPYDEEILDSYEVGIKTALFENQVRVNATAFYYDYQDYQALTFSGLSQFINNADTIVYGLDLEVVWLPGENWDVQVGASLLDTEVEEVTVQGVVVNDTEMVLAPEFTFNGLVRYSLPIGENNTLAFQIDFSHQGDHFFDITNSDLSEEDAYTVYNTRIGYQMGEHLNIAAWVKNLTDEEYRVYTFDFTGPAGFNQQFFAPPRWAGLTVRYEY